MDQALPTELVRSVVWKVKLIEASVRLWVARLAHVRHQAHLVLSADLRQILGQSVPSPDELEVDGPLFVGEALEDSPEASDDLVVSTAVRVHRDRLQLLSLDLLVATGTSLNRVMVQIRDVAEVALEDDVETTLDCLVLLAGFVEAGFDNEVDELFDVSLANLPRVTVLAKVDLVAVREDRGERLIDSCLKLFICQLGAVVP